ncbi:ammonium transporter [Litoribacter populi]|uniref:ammonium transporter n=1 Tax=Litoribacter populi TaxID=2598460 RepID=UPI001F33E96C|nr:ammonium transporter [Litoribacter populi]
MEGNLMINNLWMIMATILVFIMHIGFATLESGLTRQKNTINILYKNSIIPSIGILTYALIGYNIMHAEDVKGLFKLGVYFPEGDGFETVDGQYTYYTHFIFQAMFAATSATIVSGGVAERIKLKPFLLFSTLYIGLCFPIIARWKWGGGFMDNWDTPFYDFAGSTLLHSAGGWAALVGAILVGPRLGRFYQGKVRAFPGHNIPLATLGVFLLWFGWFGFNGGSLGSAEPGQLSRIFVTTAVGAASASIGAHFTSYVTFRTFDITMVLNGILAGLVSITAGADVMNVWQAALVGLVAGVMVVFGVILMDKIKVDDPVGVVPVHLMSGIWGTLAVGIIGEKAGWNQLVSQILGVLIVGGFCLVFSWVAFYTIKKTFGLRVPEDVEKQGLDIHEHSMHAYPYFGKRE